MVNWTDRTAIAAAALAAVVTAAEAHASGFALREGSPRAQANSFAGSTAAAEDISYMFFNPAALAKLDKPTAITGASYVMPSAEVSNATGSTVFAVPITGQSEIDDAGPNALVPSFYVGAPLTDEFNVGLAVNAPFGLETSYPSGWVGRYHAIDSELLTLSANPVVSYQPHRWLALAVGAKLVYADARLTNAVDLATAGIFPGDGLAELEGDDWTVGWNFGALITPVEDFTFGVAYNSQIGLDIEGDVDFTLPVVLPPGSPLTDTGAEAGIKLPDKWSFGINYDISEKWTLMAEYEYTNWSKFNNLTIEFDNPAQPNSVTVEDWHDTSFVAVGASYHVDENWSVHGGLAFDESPIPNATRTPRIPGNDRYWISAGVTYRISDWLSIDGAYTHIFIPETDINLAATDPGNLGRGNLSADVDGAVDIISIQGKIHF